MGIKLSDFELNFKSRIGVPVILQTEAAECGLACVAMIAGQLGHHVTLAALRRRYPSSMNGITLKRLVEIAGELSLHSRPLRLDVDEARKLKMPCILHWGMDHFVVLTKITRKGFHINDPAIGRRVVSFKEVDEQFTGVALEVIKGADFRGAKRPPPPSLRELAGPVQGLGRALFTIFALALCLELITLISPLIIQVVVDQVLTSADINLLNLIGAGFLFLLILQVMVSSLRTWTTMWISSHFNVAWSNTVFRHLLKLPSTYFMSRHMGDIVSRFGAVTIIQQTLTTRFVSVIIDGVMALLTISMMLFYSPLLSAITAAAFATYALVRVVYFKAIRATNYSQIADAARQQSTLLESIRAIQSLRLMNQEASQGAKYLNASVATTNSSIGLQKLDLRFRAASILIFGIQRVAVIWVGASLVLGETLSAGMLLAFLAYVDQFSARGASLIDYLVDLRLLRLQGERLSDIVHTEPEKDGDASYVGPPPASTMAFKSVGFQYSPSDPWVLQGASFEVNEGEVVAIVGPSGAGKSTLVRLMSGLVDAQIGSVEVGGIDIHRLGKRELRRICAFVTQEERLFSGSVAENISLNDADATLEDIVRAATIAELNDEIAAMPMGYHTIVGDIGSTLSAGQQQRLILARAIYRRPRILVLDEATSNLDVPREKKILDNLAEIGITRILIAHRPETIMTASRVFILNGGRLYEAQPKRDQPEVDAEVNAAIH